MVEEQSSGFAGLSENLAEREKNITGFAPGMDPEEGDLPITVEKIRFLRPRESGLQNPGQPVAVRWCGETEKGEDGQQITRFGYYLGDLPRSPMAAYDKRDSMLSVYMHANPAIFVPSLSRVVWGMESWWGPIENEEALKKITDKSISEVWYVKALKAFMERDA